MSKNVVVLLHGVGSNGDDLAQLADLWKEQIKDVVWISPDAPFACDMGPGYQWFSLQGITTANRPERIKAVRPKFDELIGSLFQQYEIEPEKDNIIFVGFSQGSMMSLDALVSERWPLKGVIAFSGRLASVEPFQFSHSLPVLLVHGLNDPVVPSFESEAAAEKLTELGHQVSTQFEPGLVHSISAAGVATAAKFIDQIFKAE